LRGECTVRRAEERATSMSPRKALFTASSLGKTFATYGSRTTTFVEARTRLAYLPRTNSPKSDRLYSGRSQSFSSGLPFFINFPLPFRCESGTNDSDSFATLSVGNNKQSSFRRKAKGDESAFTGGVIRIQSSGRKWITEGGCCLCERNAMLCPIQCC